MKPLLSIVTSTFNAERYLPQLIASVAEQKKPEVQWIIVDGASGDATLDILRGAADVVDLLISEPDRGIYDAWNKGLGVASGTWIMFVGADDYFLPGAIERTLAAAISAADDINFVVPSILRVDERDEHVIDEVSRPWNWQKICRWMNIAHPGALHRADLFRLYGGFDVRYRSAGDYDFLLRVGPHIRADFMPEPSLKVRVGGASYKYRALVEAQMVRRHNLGISSLRSTVAFAIALGKHTARRFVSAVR